MKGIGFECDNPACTAHEIMPSAPFRSIYESQIPAPPGWHVLLVVPEDDAVESEHRIYCTPACLLAGFADGTFLIYETRHPFGTVTQVRVEVVNR
jgi:hypothetical protein